MYKATVRDFVDVKCTKNNMPLESTIHIAKRLNNPKRDYLFINNFLGKHIPMSPSKILNLYSQLYDEIYTVLKGVDNILVVSFAETATSIGEYVMRQGKESDKPLHFIHYLQTTRESFNSSFKLIDFEEEHSHATNQSVYNRAKNIDFDCVLFVEDEITTGKTIRNFVKAFNKLRPYCDYYVASFLNWQNSENKAAFESENIESISLISGEIKETLPSLEVKQNELQKLKISSSKSNVTSQKFLEERHQDLRLGIESSQYSSNLHNSLLECVKKVIDFVNPDDILEVLGTEEFMFLPLLCGIVLEDILGNSRVFYHATTRSPIITSYDLGYCMHNGLSLTSAYDLNRETYLYNMSMDSNKIICITEKGATEKFKLELSGYCKRKNKELLIIEV